MGLKAKQYTLITGEPLTEFEESVLRMLHDVSATGYKPKAMTGAVIADSGEVMTFYHNAEMTDMMIAKGFLELDIINDNVLGNLPWFLEQAQKDGLIELMDDDDEFDWDGDNEEDIEDG